MSEEIKKETTVESKAPAKGTVEVKPSRNTDSKSDAPRSRGPRKPFDKDAKGKGNRKPRKNNKRDFKRENEFEEKVVNVARVTTVVKGGRRFSFSVLVVIGDKKGKVGYGHGKAGEVPDAIKKAIKDARKNLVTVPMIDKRTIPHEIKGKFISSNILLKPAPKGKGLIASGGVRAVIELAGYKDVVTKSLGSSNKTNVVKATVEALKQLRTVEEIAKLRDISVSQVLGRG